MGSLVLPCLFFFMQLLAASCNQSPHTSDHSHRHHVASAPQRKKRSLVRADQKRGEEALVGPRGDLRSATPSKFSRSSFLQTEPAEGPAERQVSGCPLPFEDIQAASWCDLKDADGVLHPIATYGLSSKDEVSQTVCSSHVWENHITPQDFGLPKGLKNRDGGPAVVLDIGGNIGATVMMFAKSGYRVTAVEAMSRNRHLMNATLCANPDVKALVTIVPKIVGTPEQMGMLCKVCIDFGGDASVLCPGDGRGKECDSMEPEKQKKIKEHVRVKTIDQILEDYMLANAGSVDIVKMDIEGYECNAMKGATRLLKEIRPRFIMSELQNNAPDGALVGCTPAEFINMFRNASYDVHIDHFSGKRLAGAPLIKKQDFPTFYFVRQDAFNYSKS